jgi:YidC/Oxa1 family membrane protein insertase
MERRALVAVVLMAAILVLWSFLTPREARKPAEEAPAPAFPPDTPEVAEADTTQLITPQSVTSNADAEARDIEVRTPLYSVVLSTRGAAFTSFRLNEYLSPEDEPVELIPRGGPGSLGLALLTQSGGRIDLSSAVFETGTDAVILAEGEERRLVLSLVTPEGLRVDRGFRFTADSYAVDLSLDISGPGASAVRAVDLGWQSGLRSTEANRKDDLKNFAAVALGEEGLEKADLGKVQENEEVTLGGGMNWAGVKTKYFFAGLVAEGANRGVARAFIQDSDAIGVGFEVDRSGSQTQHFMVYAGPLDHSRLKALGHGLDQAVDFGWKWIQPLSKLMFYFILQVHKVVPNYGLVIILLSALTKLLFYPLTQKSFKSMRDMQKLQPAMEELRNKYKSEPKRLNEEMMKLYREKGVNPVGGCLPLLLQMPVFISLFNVLSRTIELRRAGFVFWIQDLSTPDVIARLPFSLPFIGSAVSVLPILMGIAMFVQQKMSATDPKHAAMTYLLPIVFTVMFFRFPSGLVLYWLVNNVLTIGHQYLMIRADRKHEAQKPPEDS